MVPEEIHDANWSVPVRHGQLQEYLAKFGVAHENHSRGELIALLSMKIIDEASSSPVGGMHHLAKLTMNLSRTEVVDAAVTVRLVEVIYHEILNSFGA